MVEMNPTTVQDAADAADLIVDSMSERQVSDIALIDVRKVTTLAEYFVIGTANNERQMKAVVDGFERELYPRGLKIRAREGSADSGWMLLDFGDVIVHLFSPEARAFYRLDELWGRGAPVVRFT